MIWWACPECARSPVGFIEWTAGDGWLAVGEWRWLPWVSAVLGEDRKVPGNVSRLSRFRQGDGLDHGRASMISSQSAASKLCWRSARPKCPGRGRSLIARSSGPGIDLGVAPGFPTYSSPLPRKSVSARKTHPRHGER